MYIVNTFTQLLRSQVLVKPVEQDNPMALLQTPNTAFTKLATLLVYLVSCVDLHAEQVPSFNKISLSGLYIDSCQS